MPFFLIFVIIPLIEISVFIAVGDRIGLFQTLLLCLMTAIIGGYLVRKQGLETLFKGQKALNKGEFPLEEMFDGFCLVVAGAMLITPGFVTDIIGFSLLIPGIRTILRKNVAGRMNIQPQQSFYENRNRSKNTHDIIEGDFERLDDKE